MSETFGQRVRRMRLERGLTQRDLGRVVGRSGSMIAAIESGNRQIHVDELSAFADALGVVPAALVATRADAFNYQEGFDAGRRFERERIQTFLASTEGS